MNKEKIKAILQDIREDACDLFDIHHPKLDSGFAPSKRIIHSVDEALLELNKPKPYYPLGQEPVPEVCLSCTLQCPTDCPLDKEPITKNCFTCKKYYSCDLPMDCQGRQWEADNL